MGLDRPTRGYPRRDSQEQTCDLRRKARKRARHQVPDSDLAETPPEGGSSLDCDGAVLFRDANTP